MQILLIQGRARAGVALMPPIACLLTKADRLSALPENQ
jgi:hypothetical protein